MRRRESTRDNLRGRTTYLRGLEAHQRDQDLKNKAWDEEYQPRRPKNNHRCMTEWCCKA